MTGTLGITHSACPVCRRLVPARVEVRDSRVRFRKLCPEHGESESAVHGDAAGYLAAQRYVKPAWVPRESAGYAAAGCPGGCGLCPRHEQHLCMPIVEITGRCDLACPVCLVDAGAGPDLTLAEFRAILDGLVRAEGQVDVLNLSGGEPLRHPEFLALLDAAVSRPEVVRVSVSTNGLRLLEEPRLLAELKARNAVVSLQFDGFREEIYARLRGRRLLDRKLELLDALAAADLTASLTMTLAAGVNDDQFPGMLECLFSRPNLVSLMVQPLALEGRARASFAGVERLGIPEAVRLLGAAGHPAVRAEDFVPLPCSHPLCFSLAFYLGLKAGGFVPVNRLVDAATAMDAMANRTVFGLEAGEYARLRELVYQLWSGPAGSIPDGPAVIDTLREIMRRMSCSCFDPRKAFTLAERHVKSIFIHAFQDAGTFDLARLRRCCNAYPQRDGRLLPACARNVLGIGR